MDYILALLQWYSHVSHEAMTWYVTHTSAILDTLHIGFQATFDALLLVTTCLAVLYVLLSLLVLIVRPKTKRYTFDPKRAPRITVHIPTRNELAALRCARACLAWDYPADKIQILIGDDSDDPRVSAGLVAFARRNPRVRVIKRPVNEGYKAGNLNNMLLHTTGEILLVFDSDYIPEPDFARRIVAPFQHDKRIVAVQARWKPINKRETFSATLGFAITESFHQVFLPFMHWIGGSVMLCGSAEAVRVADLKRLGGWQHGSLTEDIEYALRLHRHGHHVVYLHDLTCGMEVPNTPKDLYRQQMRWAFGVVNALRDHAWGIFWSRGRVTLARKYNTLLLFPSGYLLTTLILFLFATGILAFFTHPPGPFNLALFATETAKNIAFTSGLLATFIVGMCLGGRWRSIPKLIVAMFSVGFVVTYYVNRGVWRALRRGKMQWFLVKKEGNAHRRAR